MREMYEAKRQEIRESKHCMDREFVDVLIFFCRNVLRIMHVDDVVKIKS